MMRDALSLDLPLNLNEHMYLTRVCAVYFLSDYHFSPHLRENFQRTAGDTVVEW